MAYIYRHYEPHVLLLDYERSLRAAFLFDELKDLASEALPVGAEIFATFLVPFLVAIKTKDRDLHPKQREQFRNMRRNLQRRHRRDLDDLRLLFRLSGMIGDPFW